MANGAIRTVAYGQGAGKRETRLRVILVLASVVLSLLLAEVAVRARDAIRGDGFFSNLRNALARPKPILPFLTFGFPLYAERDGVVYISSRHGELYPLKKASGTTRIIAFGGSTTEDGEMMRRHGTHYPKELQAQLRERLRRESIEVINVGNSAWATPHALILLSLTALSWDPDIVILSENVNDLTAAYFPGKVFDYSNKFSHPFYSVPDLSARYTLTAQLPQYSQLYWVVQERLGAWRYERGEEYELRRASYGHEPPAAAREAFKRNLQSFVSVARARGIKVVLGTQPLERSEEYFKLHMGYKPYNNVAIYPLHSEFVAHHQAYNQTIRDVARDERQTLADNDAVFANDRALFVDFVHYTLAGTVRLARNYADVLTREGLIR